MTESSDHLVFVYGTLKRGEPNHGQMLNQEDRCAQFLGCGETMEKYPLVVEPDSIIPFLIKVENKGHTVKGELYRVNDQMLKHLDWFESHPYEYLRQETSISFTRDQDDHDIAPPESKKCWVYFQAETNQEMLKLNYLSDYKSTECQTSKLFVGSV